jgi:hypothetical protein
MSTTHKAWTETVTWEQVRLQVMMLNPELAAAIDKVSPNGEDILYLMHFPFGSKIFESGMAFIPTNDGRVAPLSDPHIPQEIANNLRRRFLPVSLILDKSAEVFFSIDNSLVTVNYLERGSFFGLWEAFDPPKSHYIKDIWNISSGARSLFLVPKTTDAASYKGLRNFYKIRSKSPKDNYGHWETFVEIANSPHFDQVWTTDILVFPDTWMNKIANEPSWLPLKVYCLEYCWRQSQYWRNKVTFDIVWELFTTELMGGQLKPNPYHISLVKHLSLIGTSVLPGFAVAHDDNQAAPITGLKQAYAKHYKLKDYIPIFMAPKYLSAKDNVPVYFSFQNPGLLESPPSSRKMPSIRNAMIEVDYITETFRLEVLERKIRTQDTPIDTFANDVICEYYHSDVTPQSHRPLQPTSQLFVDDAQFYPLLPKKDGETKTNKKIKTLPETSPFLRCCVKLSFKEQN